jgi:hypothetical protein
MINNFQILNASTSLELKSSALEDMSVHNFLLSKTNVNLAIHFLFAKAPRQKAIKM